jgi:hypothetical protein
MSKSGLVVVLMTFWAGAAGAQLAPPRRPVDPGSPRSDQYSGSAAQALVRGLPQDALRLADTAVATDPANPWGHYDRGAALTSLGRTDEAVAAFRDAQRTFTAQDPWGLSIAIYGRANALARAGRCPEAQTAFEEYATYVARVDPRAATLAREYARDCVTRPR